MKKIKTTFLLILIIFCFTGLTSCDYVENNNDNIDKPIDYFYPVYVDVLFDSQLNSESTLKANLNYAYVSSVQNYTCEPPKIEFEYCVDMFKLSILNVEKYGDSLINDNMFKASDEFFYDAFACKPCFKFNEVSKNEYVPLNEDIRKFYITPIYKMRDKIKYNYSFEINIDKDIFTSDSGRICVTGIMIVASPILINKDELTTSEYVNEFNNSNSYDEFENYADKFNTKFIYYMSYYLYDYKILGNNISFEYVDINYDYY